MQRVVFDTETFRLAVDEHGRLAEFTDRRSGRNHAESARPMPFAVLRTAAGEQPAVWARPIPGGLRLGFAGSPAEADLAVAVCGRSATFEVTALRGTEADSLTFCNGRLDLAAEPADPFAACVLALNLKTNVPEMPGLNRRLRAIGYRKFGIVGARAALLGAPPAELRGLIQEVVLASDALPKSPVGGAWALDTPKARGSYVFDLGDMSEFNVGEWIAMLKQLGFTQVEFHGAEARSFRFGDCMANPRLHPRGWDSVKAMIDRLHAAGIDAVLHTYAFCIDKRCAWVTPRPDPRLAKDAVFTLAKGLDEQAADIPVCEDASDMSAVHRAHLPQRDILQNSLVLQIDDELIEYGLVRPRAPFGFGACRRGALGTRPAAHAAGAPVAHLKECFGLFLPDGESTLFSEVAARTADFYNTCGYDLIYLDALDAEAAVNGRPFGWHYGAKFAWDLFRRLKKPALMEMATFHHHLWHVRSRVGTWDCPIRGYKRFIDFHAASNARDLKMFMPGHLGWWHPVSGQSWSADKGWTVAERLSINHETQFDDDIEYLCGKALATDNGISMSGFHPGSLAGNETNVRKAAIIRQYEEARRAGDVPEAIKAELCRPGVEGRLLREPGGAWRLRPRECLKRKAAAGAGEARLEVVNRFERQPLRLRLEALLTAAAYGAPEARVLAGFADPAAFGERRAAPGVRAEFGRDPEPVRPDLSGVCFRAVNTGAEPAGAWSVVERRFSPPADVEGREALGFWVHGDGSGAVLNIQLRNALHVSTVCFDRCLPLDFTGWRYCELVEADTDHHARYAWPYRFQNSLMEFPSDPDELEALVGSSRHLYRAPYHVFGASLDPKQVESLGLWLNNVPAGGETACRLSPLKALPLLRVPVREPRVTLGGRSLVFPVTLEPGQYLEAFSAEDCALYRMSGERIGRVQPRGEWPDLDAGPNAIELVSAPRAGEPASRLRATVFAEGA